MVGIVNIEEAMRRAREAGLDLVEVAADSDPPVCRIRDYGKFKYEQSKKDKASKARSKMAEMKEVRLGRSMKIDPHDVEIRMSQARRFLMDGHKVQIVQNFRGREMIHRERGSERMREIVERLSDISKLETPPRQAGKRMTMILAPDKSKIEQVRRREATARQKAAETEEGSAKDVDEREPAEAPSPASTASRAAAKEAAVEREAPLPGGSGDEPAATPAPQPPTPRPQEMEARRA
jgi:translation initiation factor IF-3